MSERFHDLTRRMAEPLHVTASSGCELQEGNHPLLQLRLAHLQYGVQRKRINHVELAGNAAAQRGQMRAAAEVLAEFVRHTADIRALGASQAELPQRLGVAH